MQKDSITISEALQKIHTWMDEKNYEKSIQGCREILQIDPENVEAKSILENAEILKKDITPPMPDNTEEKIIIDDPLPNLPIDDDKNSANTEKVKFPEITPGYTNSDITFSKTKNPTFSTDEILMEPMENEEKTKHFAIYLIKKIATILFIFVIVGAIGYGGFLAYSSYKNGGIHLDEIVSKINIFSSKKTEPITSIEKSIPPDEPKKPTESIESIEPEPDPMNIRNTTRTAELRLIQTALETYHTDKGHYPAANEVEKELIENGYMTEIPLDPRHDEKDEADQPFGYVYAVYDTEQFFILSALFENPTGENILWSPMETQAHEDYRDLEKENVKLLSSSISTETLPEPADDSIPPKREKVRRIP